MADAVVGTLRAILSLDSAQFDAGAKKASASVSTLGKNLERLTPQAERMVKAFAGDRIITQANNLAAAVQKIGGASRLTNAEQARVNTTITQAIEKYRALGQQAPAALLNLSNATKGASGPTQFLTTKMVALGAAVGTFVSNLAFQGVRTLVGFGRNAFDTAGQIIDLRSKTGETTTSLQRMQFVADQTGTSLEGMTDAAFMLRTRLAGGAGSVVSALVELRNASGDAGLTTRSSADQILTALSQVTDAETRLRLGTELFGRSYRQLAASVTEGYADIAKGATLSSKAQLEALDRAGDRWAAFVRNNKTNVTAFLGQMLVMQDAIREVNAERGWMNGPADPYGADYGAAYAANVAEARRRVQLGLMGGQSKDIDLDALSAAAAAKGYASYAAQLAAVRAELAALTPAQRQEIDAAQQLGVSTDDLETKYGLTEGALRLLNAQTKDYEKTLKSTTDQAKTWAGTLSEIRNQIGMTQFGAGAAAEQAAAHALASMDAFNEEAAQKDEAYARSKRQLTNELEEQRIRSHGSANEEIAQQDTRLRAIQNELGLDVIRAAQERQDRANAQRQQIVDFWKRQLGAVDGATTGRLGSLFFGGVGRDVGDDMRQFATRWKAWTDGLTDTFEGALNEMLQHFLRQFIGGMIKGIVGARLGQTLGNALMGSVAGTAIGGGAAALAGGSGAAAAVAGVESAALGGTAAGGGATLAALATNPWTIGAAGAIALGLLVAKKGLFRGGEEAMHVNPRRDQFMGQFGGGHNLAARLTGLSGEHGGGHLFAALQRADSVKEFEAAQSAIAAFLGQFKQRVKLFNFGGFVPPGVTQPAILHGGAFGEDVISRTSSQPSAGLSLSIHQTFNISSIDARGVREFVESRDFLDSFARVIEHNKGFIATRVRPSLVS